MNKLRVFLVILTIVVGLYGYSTTKTAVADLVTKQQQRYQGLLKE